MMNEEPSDQEIRDWHRRFGVQANNRAWTLSELSSLEAEEKIELLYAAYAAAHHWSKIGTEDQMASAQLLLGRVHALLGHAALAMEFATAAFGRITSRDSAPWEVAFAHAVLADAAAISQEPELHREHYLKARELGEGLDDPQDKELFLATFDLIPAPGTKDAGG